MLPCSSPYAQIIDLLRFSTHQPWLGADCKENTGDQAVGMSQAGQEQSSLPLGSNLPRYISEPACTAVLINLIMSWSVKQRGMCCRPATAASVDVTAMEDEQLYSIIMGMDPPPPPTIPAGMDERKPQTSVEDAKKAIESAKAAVGIKPVKTEVLALSLCCLQSIVSFPKKQRLRCAVVLAGGRQQFRGRRLQPQGPRRQEQARDGQQAERAAQPPAQAAVHPGPGGQRGPPAVRDLPDPAAAQLPARKVLRCVPGCRRSKW